MGFIIVMSILAFISAGFNMYMMIKSSETGEWGLFFLSIIGFLFAVMSLIVLAAS